jgi:hypothetical protein
VGYDIRIMHKEEDSTDVYELGHDELGDVVVKLPLPPGFII